jgi:membrane protease YdiL (CAAX protease family)
MNELFPPPIPPDEPPATGSSDATGAASATDGPPSSGIPPPPRIPADLRTPWDGVDLILFFGFALGVLVLLSNILAVAAVTIVGVGSAQIKQYTETDAGFIVTRQVFWFGALMLYLFAFVRRRTPEPFWRALGWRMPRLPMPPLAAVPLLLLAGAVVAVGANIASRIFTTERRLPIEAMFTSRRSVTYLMAFGILVAPLVEETIFRGFLYPVLARKFSVAGGIIFTGAFFGLVHAPQLWGGWGQIGTLIVVGMIFTAVRAATQSVFASFLLHLGYNCFLFGGFFLATDALRHLPK